MASFTNRIGATVRAPALTLGLVIVCAALAIAGCGGGNGGSTSEVGAANSPSSKKTIAGKTEPVVRVPDIPPPTRLIVKNLEVGHGPKAVVGDHVRVEYLGINWAGEPYSNSWEYPSPPAFALGIRAERRLEYGLDLAVRGMQVGGRREVIIPPQLVSWPDKPHASFNRINTLVFVIDLLKIH